MVKENEWEVKGNRKKQSSQNEKVTASSECEMLC